jgi:hypothetical protein
MSYQIPLFYVGVIPANIDMSNEASFQFAGVSLVGGNSQGTGIGGAALDKPSTSSNPILGVLQNNPLAGEAGQVMVEGVTQAIASGSFNIGDLLMVDGNGAFLKATSTNYAVAQALEVAQSGDITTVLLRNFGKQ